MTSAESFIVDTATVVSAIAERRDDLSTLVANANATARAIANENAALAPALELLPTTLRKANTTFVNLRAALGDLDVLGRRVQAGDEGPRAVLACAETACGRGEPTIRDLRVLIKSGPGNDLTDLLRKQPELARRASAAFPRSIRALQKAQPVLEYIRPYTPELVGWIPTSARARPTTTPTATSPGSSRMFNSYPIHDRRCRRPRMTPVQDAAA